MGEDIEVFQRGPPGGGAYQGGVLVKIGQKLEVSREEAGHLDQPFGPECKYLMHSVTGFVSPGAKKTKVRSKPRFLVFPVFSLLSDRIRKM